MFNDGKIQFDPENPEEFRPRRYAIKAHVTPRDLEDREPINFKVSDTVEDLVRRLTRRWAHTESFEVGKRSYQPEIVVKFVPTVDPWGIDIIASMHEAGQVAIEDIK